jgi:hypothetical protein
MIDAGMPIRQGCPPRSAGTTVIRGRTLDLAPSQIEMFGSRFPAADVLSQVEGQQTAFPLQALPSGLTYSGVSVGADGLLIRLTGRSADLPRGSLTGGGC